MVIILQILTFIISVVCGLSKKKRNILLLIFIGNLLGIFQMLVVGRADGAVANAVCTIRAFLYLYKENAKTNIIFYICFCMHLLGGILTYQDITSVISIVAVLLVCAGLWFGNELVIKVVIVISDVMWSIFNGISGLYISSVRNIIDGAFNLIAAFRIKNDKIGCG